MAFIGALLTGFVSRSHETVQAHRLLRDGHSGAEKFMAGVARDSSEILAIQESGFAFRSAGQLDWLDLMRPIASSFAGFGSKTGGGEDSVGPVTRWFSTNTFYRKPTISSALSCKGHELAGFLPSAKDGIVFLPGPYSFFRLSKNTFYREAAEFARDYGDAIAKSAARLLERGYKAVVFSEPSVGYDAGRKNFDGSSWDAGYIAKVAASGLVAGVNFPMADAAKALPLVENSAAGFVCLDLRCSEFAGLGTRKAVVLGVVDGARIGVETPQQIVSSVEKSMSLADFRDVYIGPSDRLSDVPFEQGLAKIRSLSIASRQLASRGAVS